MIEGWRDEQSMKASLPIVLTELPIVTDLTKSQSENALLPIVSTEFPIVY